MSGLPCDLCGAYAEDGAAFCCPKCRIGRRTMTTSYRDDLVQLLARTFGEEFEAWQQTVVDGAMELVTSARAEGHAAGVAEERTRVSTWLTDRIEALLSAPVAMCGGPVAVEATFLALLEAREFAAGRLG